jgi:patatin-related protein
VSALAAVPASAGTTPLPGTVTELRIALVCYGGVSLAVYMHGVTKELHKLVVASRRFDELGPAAANPFDADTDTEHAYFEALADLAGENHLLSVTIDVVAGTSAGGINGVCLAKVLARNGSDEALKRLWIDEGDLVRLLHAPPVGGWRTRAVLAFGRVLAGLNRPISPLRGDRMSRLLYDALADMEHPVDPDRRTLLLPGAPLDLLVTTTDLAGLPVLVPSGTGGISQRETDRAQVVQLSSHGDDLVFGPDSTGALAFAARATSCFPGAFAPVSLASFAQELGGRAYDPDAVRDLLRRRADDSVEDHRFYVDGGVLDNGPFDLVIEAIAGKQARTEVVRRLVYVQPDPGERLEVAAPQAGQPAPDASAPGYLRALATSLSTVKGSHSILRDLEDLRDLNLRIAELGAIAALQVVQVDAAIDAAWEATARPADGGAPAGGSRRPDQAWSIEEPDDVARLGDSLHAGAPAFAGASFSSYCRLKVEAAGARLADEVVERFVYPPGSSRSSFVRAALSAWARSRIEWQRPDPTRLIELLGPVDVPYRERRIMFVLAGINALYPLVGTGPGAPSRSSLDALKSQAWGLLDRLRTAPALAMGAVTDSDVRFLGADLSDETVFASPEAFAARSATAFEQLFTTYRAALSAQVSDSSVPLWRSFVTLTIGWAPEHRRAVLSRFLGFVLWDALIFPTIAYSALPQFTPITVSQFSPLSAAALTTPAGGKLKGVSLGHFGGFVDAGWRENDYLWGRLDAAELILRVLRGSRPGAVPATATTPGEATAQAGRRLRGALSAVLASEQDLHRVAALRTTLATEVAALTPVDPT